MTAGKDRQLFTTYAMKATIEWMSVSKGELPEHHRFVLVETPYCKYPHCTALYNGVHWIGADECAVMNVEFWAYVQTPTKAHGDGG